jgi:hypothetical protein
VTDSGTPSVVTKRHDYFAFGEDPAPMDERKYNAFVQEQRSYPS